MEVLESRRLYQRVMNLEDQVLKMNFDREVFERN